MRFLKLGATALAGVFLAAGAMAPVAMAQPVAQVSKAMATAFNEANAAIAAKDWARFESWASAPAREVPALRKLSKTRPVWQK